MITVKQGDRYPIDFIANMDLTGSTIRLTAKLWGQDALTLDATITDPVNGVVTHTLDGTLPVGRYYVELEVMQGSQVVTFPSEGYETLTVEADLD